MKCVLLDQAQSPSITESFPRAHTVDVQAATRVPLLPWRLAQGFCAKKNGACLAASSKMMSGRGRGWLAGALGA